MHSADIAFYLSFHPTLASSQSKTVSAAGFGRNPDFQPAFPHLEDATNIAANQTIDGSGNDFYVPRRVARRAKSDLGSAMDLKHSIGPLLTDGIFAFPFH